MRWCHLRHQCDVFWQPEFPSLMLSRRCTSYFYRLLLWIPGTFSNLGPCGSSRLQVVPDCSQRSWGQGHRLQFNKLHTALTPDSTSPSLLESCLTHPRTHHNAACESNLCSCVWRHHLPNRCGTTNGAEADQEGSVSLGTRDSKVTHDVLVHTLSLRTVCPHDAVPSITVSLVMVSHRVMSSTSSISISFGGRLSFLVPGVFVLPPGLDPVRFRHLSM